MKSSNKKIFFEERVRLETKGENFKPIDFPFCKNKMGYKRDEILLTPEGNFIIVVNVHQMSDTPIVQMAESEEEVNQLGFRYVEISHEAYRQCEHIGFL